MLRLYRRLLRRRSGLKGIPSGVSSLDRAGSCPLLPSASLRRVAELDLTFLQYVA
uniref:Ribonucleotide reductase n=1 Tax=uncultured marine virus TaxID=186617 RepID=A0A0F7LBC6_9VIRU|nr:ribonucleotide reductase [uncultured marine virus]